MSLIAEKKVFHIDSFSFQNGRTLPVQMGYETYGTLNADKSNAILVEMCIRDSPNTPYSSHTPFAKPHP